jgi:DNA-binding NarL/FixJ family response regulator
MAITRIQRKFLMPILRALVAELPVAKIKRPSPVRTPRKKYNILVVDDHALFRRGLADLLDRELDMAVLGQVGTGAEALVAIRGRAFELVIMDIGLGDGADGLETAKIIKAEQPGLWVLFISVRDEAIYAGRALRAGASGYIMKRESLETVLAGLRTIFAGEVHVSVAMRKRMIANHIHGSSETGAPIDLLTDRELEVLHLFGHGHAVIKIATDLKLSRKTIEAHREHIKRKLGFSSSRELVRFAVQRLEDG